MSISLYGAHSDPTEETFFGRHGFKRVMCRGKLVRIIHPDGRKARVGTLVRLSWKKHAEKSGHGLADIPLQSAGRVVDIDLLTKSRRVLRVVFEKDKRKGVISMDFDEVEIVNY